MDPAKVSRLEGIFQSAENVVRMYSEHELVGEALEAANAQFRHMTNCLIDDVAVEVLLPADQAARFRTAHALLGKKLAAADQLRREEARRERDREEARKDREYALREQELLEEERLDEECLRLEDEYEQFKELAHLRRKKGYCQYREAMRCQQLAEERLRLEGDCGHFKEMARLCLEERARLYKEEDICHDLAEERLQRRTELIQHFDEKLRLRREEAERLLREQKAEQL
ncbi:MAG: hypothetical protein WCJ28_06365, partial [Actinomycetota bacterium]